MTLNQFIDCVLEKKYSPTTIRVLLALLEQLEYETSEEFIHIPKTLKQKLFMPYIERK